MPAILGWLIAGMILGPHALALMPQAVMDDIVDLGAPLDYHLILGAGLYTFIYIAAKKGFELAGEIQSS